MKFISIIAALVLSAGGVSTAAHADPEPYLPGGARDVVNVDPAPAGPRITVYLSNGAVDVLRPCKYEDGKHCYWLADQMGNGKGTSFIVTRGRVHYVKLRNFDPLAREGVRMKTIAIVVSVFDDTDIFEVHEQMLDQFDDHELSVYESVEALVKEATSA